jgi:vacuolar-type H+-ATPase subunit E/Vma4
MNDTRTGTPDLLCEAIFAEARQQRDDILDQARREAQALHDAANAHVDQVRSERLAEARLEAARRKERLLASVPVEAGRLRGARIESLLQAVHDRACRQLDQLDGFDYREAIVALAAEAIEGMDGHTFILKLTPADRDAFAEALLEAVPQRVRRQSVTLTVLADSSITGGGVTVVDGEGRQLWDNRLQARLERLWPELRRQIAVQTSLIPARSREGGGA